MGGTARQFNKMYVDYTALQLLKIVALQFWGQVFC